jgi:hypothetical protein
VSFATEFVRFREWQVKVVKVDTIPKPVGLGSRGPARGLGRSAFVRGLFGSFSVCVRYLFGYVESSLRCLMDTHGQRVSEHSR